MLGVAPHVVDRVLGHVPTGVTAEVYNLYEYSTEKRSALDALGERVAALKAGEPAKIVPIKRRNA